MVDSPSKIQLIKELERLYKQTGDTPTAKMMQNQGEFAKRRYSEEFGSWNSGLKEAGFEVNRSYDVSREELIENIRKVKNQIGRVPRVKDINEYGEYCRSRYETEFGSWTKAIKASGFEPKNKRNISDEELLEHLVFLKQKINQTPRSSDMDKIGDYSSKTYTTRFGSWRQSLVQAGLSKSYLDNISRDQLLETLKKVDSKVDGVPKTKQVIEIGEYSDYPYRREFGTIKKAIEELGYSKDQVDMFSHLDVSEEMLGDELRRLNKKLKRTPRSNDMEEYGNYGKSTYESTFGSWIEALEYYGFNPEYHKGAEEKFSEEDCIKVLERADNKIKGSVSTSDFKEVETKISHYQIVQIFGSWNKAKERAGLSKHNFNYDEDDCIESIREAYEILGHSPSVSEYADLSISPSKSTIKKIFGSWNDAKNAAGLETEDLHESKYTKSDCLDAIREAKKILGKNPSRSEYDSLDIQPGTTTISEICGSWGEAKKNAGLGRLKTGVNEGYAYYTKNECLDALNRVFNKINSSPSKKDYRNEKKHSEPSIHAMVNCLGKSWNEIKKELDLHQYHKSVNPKDCIEAVKYVSKMDSIDLVTQNTYSENRKKEHPSTNAIRKYFDSWSNLQRCAGIKVTHPEYSKENCLNSIIKVKEMLGKSPTVREYESLDIRPHREIIREKCGSFNKAKEMANLDTNIHPQSTPYDRDKCINSLKRAKSKLGRSPTIREYEMLQYKPSESVIKRLFESWNEAKKEAGLEIYNTESESQNRYYGVDWNDTKDSILDRDNYQCRNCCKSIEEHIAEYSMNLHIHHIIKFDKFDSYRIANHSSNLVALCCLCHKRIERLETEEQCEILDLETPKVSPNMCQTKLEFYSN